MIDGKAGDNIGLYMVGGEIIITGDVAKALALGADAIAMASAIEIAAGCILCGQCSTGKCPVGICTNDPELVKKLGEGKGISTATEWITNFIKVVTKEVAQIAGSLGHKKPKRI